MIKCLTLLSYNTTLPTPIRAWAIWSITTSNHLFPLFITETGRQIPLCASRSCKSLWRRETAWMPCQGKRGWERKEAVNENNSKSDAVFGYPHEKHSVEVTAPDETTKIKVVIAFMGGFGGCRSCTVDLRSKGDCKEGTTISHCRCWIQSFKQL